MEGYVDTIAEIIGVKAEEYFGFWPEHNMMQGPRLTYEWWKNIWWRTSPALKLGIWVMMPALIMKLRY